MKSYTLDKDHKIEVSELKQGYEVRFFENWNGTWTELGKAKGEDGVNYCEFFEKIEEDADRDYWLTAAEAKEDGLIDAVLTRRK